MRTTGRRHQTVEMHNGLEVVRNVGELTAAPLGTRVWNAEKQVVMVCVMGGWDEETGVANQNLAGYTFALTGKMWETRQKIEAAVSAEGGTVSRTMAPLTILVQGAVAGGAKSKKRQDAERNGHKVIGSNDLLAAIQGHTTIVELTGTKGRRKSKGPAKKSTSVKPIDRGQQDRTVKRVFDDIEAIVFGK